MCGQGLGKRSGISSQSELPLYSPRTPGRSCPLQHYRWRLAERMVTPRQKHTRAITLALTIPGLCFHNTTEPDRHVHVLAKPWEVCTCTEFPTLYQCHSSLGNQFRVHTIMWGHNMCEKMAILCRILKPLYMNFKNVNSICLHSFPKACNSIRF